MVTFGLLTTSPVNQIPRQISVRNKTWLMRSEISFQDVLGQLHTRVPAEKLPEISFAYCFICLLHLCNERGLEVVGDGDMKDMRIRLPAK